MKLTKSQLKELIKQAIVEDIFDKEIKNLKFNMIKIRTRYNYLMNILQIKKKDMVAKRPIDKGDVGGPSYQMLKRIQNQLKKLNQTHLMIKKNPPMNQKKNQKDQNL